MLTVKGLKKSYGSKVAVDDVNFEVGRSEIFAILGPNGAGKTTTLKCVLGLRHPDGGEVRLTGSFSYLPEEKNLYPYLRVKDMVDLFERIGKNFKREKAISSLEKYGIDPKLKVSELSHGMKTLTYLSLVLAEDVDLYVLDEPTWGLDPLARSDVLDALRSLTYEGKSVLYTSHILSEVEKVADRILIMKAGRVIVQGYLDDVKASYKLVVSEREMDGYLLKETKSEKVYLVRVDRIPEGVEVRDASFEEIFEAIVRGERDVA